MGETPAFELFDVEITAITDRTAAELLVGGDLTGCVHFVNAFSMTESTRNPAFKATLQAGTALPDGMPLVWIGRRLGIHSLTHRAYGPDVMRQCLDLGRGSIDLAFPLRHGRRDTATTPASDREFLARGEDRWFAGAIVR